MSEKYPLPITNGVHEIAFPGGPPGCHTLFFGYQAAADTGLMTVEFREIGQAAWKPIVGGTGIDLSAGSFLLRCEGAIARLRLTITEATGGEAGDLWLVSSDVPYGAFTGDKAMVIQPYDTINIKRGRQFELPILINPIATGTSYFMLAEVGDQDIIIKTREIDVNGGLEYRPWLNATYTKGALIDKVVNLNGKSATVNGTKFYDVSGVSLAGATDIDIIKSSSDTGTNRTLGQFPEGIERIVPAGSTLLLEFRNTQAQDIWVVFKTTWYEGPTDVLPDELKP